MTPLKKIIAVLTIVAELTDNYNLSKAIRQFCDEMGHGNTVYTPELDEKLLNIVSQISQWNSDCDIVRNTLIRNKLLWEAELYRKVVF